MSFCILLSLWERECAECGRGGEGESRLHCLSHFTSPILSWEPRKGAEITSFMLTAPHIYKANVVEKKFTAPTAMKGVFERPYSRRRFSECGPFPSLGKGGKGES